MRLQLCTWPEVEDRLERSRGIIVPIGATEQHGPSGFIGTDALCPELIAHGIGDELDALVAPTLSLGMSQHHLGFPGTISLRPSTLLAVVRDVAVSLTRHGFERLFFLNGHGGNVATIQAAFDELHAECSMAHDGDSRPPVRCKLQNWWDCKEVGEISAECFGDREGMHATCSEVSLTYHAHPEDARRVHRSELTPPVAPVGPIHDAADYRRRFPDGRIGSDPTLATPKIGERLYRAAVDAHARNYEAFLTED